jgi:predicted lipid-binding transport protein (Tim44 family)
MSRRRAAQPVQSRRANPDYEHWQAFVGFWLVAGLALLLIGIAMFAAVAHSHRVAALLILGGIVCLAIGFIVRRAAQRAD